MATKTYNTYDEVMGATKKQLLTFCKDNMTTTPHHATGLQTLRDTVLMHLNLSEGSNLNNTVITKTDKILDEQAAHIADLQRQIKEAKITHQTDADIVYSCDTPDGVMTDEQVENAYGVQTGETVEQRAKKLVRIRVTNNMPNRSQILSESFSFSAANVNKGRPFNRVVYFNHQGGCMVENIIYLNMKNATFIHRVDKGFKEDSEGNLQQIIEQTTLPSYNIEVLAMPTQEEIDKLSVALNT